MSKSRKSIPQATTATRSTRTTRNGNTSSTVTLTYPDGTQETVGGQRAEHCTSAIVVRIADGKAVRVAQKSGRTGYVAMGLRTSPAAAADEAARLVSKSPSIYAEGAAVAITEAPAEAPAPTAVEAKATRTAEAALARNRAANRKASAKAAKAPAKAKPRKVSANTTARLAKAADRADAVEGYALRWPHGSYDLYRATDTAPEGSPAWLVRCTAHGTTTPAANAKAGDALGAKAARAAWCKPCAKAAKAPAKAARKAVK